MPTSASRSAPTLGHDAALMPHITSANVACGFHAGDPGVMRATVALAREHGVAVGAHPGFPDLAGFGRREMQRLAARGRGPRRLPDRRAGGDRRRAGRAAAARQAARRALQHGGARRGAGRRDRARRRGGRPLADAVRAAGLGARSRPASAPGLRTASRGVRRSRAIGPTARSCRAASQARSSTMRTRWSRARSAMAARAGRRSPSTARACRSTVDTICVHGDTPGRGDARRAHSRGARATAGIEVKVAADGALR